VDSWAREAEQLGAGEILLTSVERDGTMQGYDLDLIKRVTRNAGIPVIASGGAGSYQDMYEAISVANCSAVAAASIFHFTQQTPMEAKKFLSTHRIAVRNVNVQSAPH
jgi:cyclase